MTIAIICNLGGIGVMEIGYVGLEIGDYVENIVKKRQSEEEFVGNRPLNGCSMG